VELPALLTPVEDLASREHLSDIEKLELLRNVVRSIEHDLEARPTSEDLETSPGAKGVHLLATPSLLVRSYAFRVSAPPTYLYAHEGEETVYCASGRVRVLVDREEHVLEAGEMLRFDSSRAHVVLGEPGAVAVSTAIPPPTADSIRRTSAEGSLPQPEWAAEVPRSAKAV
jgi:hypothetical protein